MKRLKRVIHSLNEAIDELKEARTSVRLKRLERAEVEIGKSLQHTGRALRHIQRNPNA